MNYLVTGGAGFIGSHIVEELVKQGHKVKVIDNLSFGKIKNIKDFINKIEFVEGDIRDLDLLKKEFKDQDFILHQAALKSVPRSFENPQEYQDVNANGTLNVLKATELCKVKKLVFASSSSVYGEPKVLPQTEDLPTNPISPYGKSKLDAEKLCLNYAKSVHLVVLRYFNVFGSRQDPKSEYAAVIPKFITLMLKDQRPVIYGDGKQSRDFAYVKKIVAANIRSCEEDVSGEIINISGNEKLTINQLAEKINKYLKKEIKPIYQAPRKGDIKHTWANSFKEEKFLKIGSKYSFDEGLKETIEWFKLLNPKDSKGLEK